MVLELQKMIDVGKSIQERGRMRGGKGTTERKAGSGETDIMEVMTGGRCQTDVYMTGGQTLEMREEDMTGGRSQTQG